ncbi:DUF2484 family protein [Yoonia sediminilitoris]|uniref:Uncharacterized protein DUF2484 n=1 Tax=Yoonia sediminilitoris TaxID=1286148 RepID=A0A2T6KQI5_9RHOB|nr:DUF2484 family protein [Yoonia sediminilitoris]PUB18827.1 uncharacterized protein DUF2484 [Yoonia sediminilitoris]RCW98995.1 uncharacterized protein DUF2484 [Yoonia sediminilitoris]
MNYSLLIGCVWVLAATGVALLPMRLQYVPGVTLLLLAPFLIVRIGYDYGWVFAVLGLFAFVSMFRNPLIYFYRRARGERPEVPK